MKKRYIILSAIALLFVFISCEEEEFEPVVGVFTPPSLTTPGSSITLVEENGDQSAGTFSWTAADFGFQSATSYVLQIAKAGTDFAEAMDLANTTALNTSFTVAEFNQKMLALGLPGDWTSDVEFRVLASVSENVQTLMSGVSQVSITTFDVVIEYPKLYVPGSYQDWDAANEKTVVYSVKSNDKYQGYLNFTEEVTEFKFTQVPAWEEDKTIADPDAEGQSGTLQIGSWGGNNIKVTTGAGYYLVKADLNAKTYSTEKTHWGLIGDATPNGWDSDQDMTYDPESGTWSVTLDLGAGKIKFRANDAWDLNYGDDGPDGKLEAGGADIEVPEAGNYTVTLNLEVPLYTYTLAKN